MVQWTKKLNPKTRLSHNGHPKLSIKVELQTTGTLFYFNRAEEMEIDRQEEDSVVPQTNCRACGLEEPASGATITETINMVVLNEDAKVYIVIDDTKGHEETPELLKYIKLLLDLSDKLDYRYENSVKDIRLSRPDLLEASAYCRMVAFYFPSTIRAAGMGGSLKRLGDLLREVCVADYGKSVILQTIGRDLKMFIKTLESIVNGNNFYIPNPFNDDWEFMTEVLIKSDGNVSKIIY